MKINIFVKSRWSLEFQHVGRLSIWAVISPMHTYTRIHLLKLESYCDTVLKHALVNITSGPHSRATETWLGWCSMFHYHNLFNPSLWQLRLILDFCYHRWFNVHFSIYNSSKSFWLLGIALESVEGRPGVWRALDCQSLWLAPLSSKCEVPWEEGTAGFSLARPEEGSDTSRAVLGGGCLGKWALMQSAIVCDPVGASEAALLAP